MNGNFIIVGVFPITERYVWNIFPIDIGSPSVIKNVSFFVFLLTAIKQKWIRRCGYDEWPRQ